MGRTVATTGYPAMPAAADPSLRPRSPVQVEASRRNGARSRGPVTPEGKRRSSANALKHGLAAMHHLVLEDEAPSELEELTARLLEEVGAETELEARLVRRMAVAFWKGERAERIEVALFDAAPKVRPPTRGGTWEDADPLTTFDLKRFNAVRGYQAQQGRELSRCLKELRQLRRDALAECTDEPEPVPQNEPEPLTAANDDAVAVPLSGDPVDEVKLQNEPEPPDPWDVLPEPTRGELDRLLAAGDWPGLARLAATGALAPLGLGPADVASPEALGRFLFAPSGPPRPATSAPAAAEGPGATRLRVAC